MTYPLVLDLAADGVPVAVTCRVLGFSKQGFYAWRANPVTDRDWADAHLVNAAIEIHHDDPEFGYRFIADELAEVGIPASRNRVARLCSAHRIVSVIHRRRGSGKTPGPAVHDDLVCRDFTATAPNQLWLTDITEHPTAEGKIYLCAIKDVFSNKIVGYSIDSRMKARLAVAALRNAVALREPCATVVHSDRGSQGEFNRSSQHLSMLEVFGGQEAAGCGSGAASEDAFAGQVGFPEAGRTRLLASDCAGAAHCRGRRGRRRVGGHRRPVVPSRWRHGADEHGRADGPVSVVR